MNERERDAQVARQTVRDRATCPHCNPGRCTTCGLPIWPDDTHECPPGFTTQEQP